MSKDDYETGKTLITPYIEIGKWNEPSPNERAYVNVETFKKCLGKLIQVRDDKGPKTPNKPFYSIYGVVNRPVQSVDGESYVNINEPPISRTLMGYLKEEVLKGKLPKTHRKLNSNQIFLFLTSFFNHSCHNGKTLSPIGKSISS